MNTSKSGDYQVDGPLRNEYKYGVWFPLQITLNSRIQQASAFLVKPLKSRKNHIQNENFQLQRIDGAGVHSIQRRPVSFWIVRISLH